MRNNTKDIHSNIGISGESGNYLALCPSLWGALEVWGFQCFCALVSVCSLVFSVLAAPGVCRAFPR